MKLNVVTLNDWKQQLVQYGPIINIGISIILFLIQYVIVKKRNIFK